MDIVEAFTLLRAAPERPRPLLLLVGTPHPPAIAAEIGAGEDVRLLGQREDVHRWMQAADVLVSGSHQDTEGMSRVLYEAMACGAVPIATDIAGNRDAVTPETGLLVPERSPDAIARAVTSLRAHPDRLAALRAQGLRRARESFDIRLHARGVEKFYSELVPLRAPVGKRA
jgi:glycosyltransferase involved in cell wall biosynthesis